MIEIEVEAPAWTAALPEAERIAVRAATAALAHGQHVHEDVDLAILLTDDETIADLNLRFRGKAGPTNVLSFPAAASARPHLGDVALAFGVCAREAQDQGKSLEHHFMHLVAHGVLHLLGYDHETDSEAESMEALERHLLKDLGVRDPYADAPPAGSHAR